MADSLDEQERQNQGQLQCKNGKPAQKRHSVTPANGEPSQPCQPQDVCGNGTLEGCIKADVLVREFPRRVWADLEHGEDIGDNRRTHGDGEKHRSDTAEEAERGAAGVPDCSCFSSCRDGHGDLLRLWPQARIVRWAIASNTAYSAPRFVVV